MIATAWQRNQDWVGTEVEDSFVMINLSTGKYLTLNPTAKAVWSLLETPRTQVEITHQLMDEFSVSEQECGDAVVKLLAEMQTLELAAPV